MMAGSTVENLSNPEMSDGDWAPTNLRKNLCILSRNEIDLAKMLIKEKQGHLFEHWPEPGIDDAAKHGFFNQVTLLNNSYPGGLLSYIRNARSLLADSKAGKNPYDGFIPSVPSGEVLSFGDENFMMLEEVGVKEACRAAFVLVAGGLGERLGYNGIKLALPSESTSGTLFLQHYIESILALQDASCKLVEGSCQRQIPLVIMTSDDTHSRTLKLLESNAYFGMSSSQVILLKQEKVACLADNDASLALDPNDKYKIQTKPHGHGDVHALLYSSGLLNEWCKLGLKWVLFFQDTNGLLFKAIPASLGVSATKSYHVNSLAVPRKAKEAIGGITRLSHADGRTMVINVEYNQLDPLLRATGHPDGDVNDETGYSPFPGNINQLILELSPYMDELQKTNGAIAEFVNPKYKDSTKTSFKSSTRLECMMQDYPKTLPPTASVGFTVMDTWLAYAPVKNNPKDAAKVPKGNPHHSATTGEMAIYRANSLILRKAGGHIEDPKLEVYNGQEVEVWPRVAWKPKWAITFADVKRKVRSCRISQRSTFVLKGPNIFIEDLFLDGALIVNSVEDAEVKLNGHVKNEGWEIRAVDYKDCSLAEEVRIRGFQIEKKGQLELNYNEPGNFSFNG
ncbi:UDP-sugar pyrophosphorylase [Nymphaea colorata]|nr:UDP-sugar pyrophosphorylase [Nymphaea colorata]XP_031495468.1 UDP-sugar pyrophosphorylase [Nymphaea colorata]XP_031495478.1 UDP-sugar pyrophosphorylase [Nymphaea colorata]XP_031495487.1 UDP-sugar pyrophosphorylase [Nymphaea colorata]XP_031495503.1 UDP-sugar pyrophosphorylase [Nymphaea colorata]XP_031495511.1 UDP-sugar pyrophosphorylase [Nymphaea colorata]XP_031495520.1 UDP-sugar pyrophosphorylase [Nymphaea colorata]XP_031495528.1 UDP-sugar pyrophosphorylase [Nymphaea colorata]XP_04993534